MKQPKSKKQRKSSRKAVASRETTLAWMKWKAHSDASKFKAFGLNL